MSSTYPYGQTSNFVKLLNTQQDSVPIFVDPFLCVALGSSQPLANSSFTCEDTPAERRERRKWTLSDDILLISSWLNMSKDPVVGNEQKSGAFWIRIARYFAASPKAVGPEIREPIHCKQRWQKINNLVCKFCGAYEAATREKTSGQNENDVLKLAHEIFYNDHKKKFTLDHAWKELRNDQKWCELFTSKTNGSCKRRRCDDGAHSSSSHADEGKTSEEVQTRPPGVKAAKARGKKSTADGSVLSEFQSMWAIKEKDLERKERLSKHIAKKEPLSDYEEALKKKLISDILAD